MRLVYGHFDLGHTRFGKAQLGDTLGYRLDQVDGIPPNGIDDSLSDGTIVDGLREVICASGGTGVQPQRDVDEERLAQLALGGEYAMVTVRAKTTQRNTVHAPDPFCSRSPLFTLAGPSDDSTGDRTSKDSRTAGPSDQRNS